MLDSFRLPKDSERVAIFGRTGSGKTQFGTWLLSRLSWNKIPWIVLDFKREGLFSAIPDTTPMDIDARIPRKAGVYVCSPIVADKADAERLNQLFRRIWEKERVGIFVDEGYMATGLRWFRACLQQGRSRRIPMIILSQRPVWMDRFVWSEASQFIAFDLTLEDDRQTANKLIPGYSRVSLPDYHAVWHDVSNKTTAVLTPAPASASIIAGFRERAPMQRKTI